MAILRMDNVKVAVESIDHVFSFFLFIVLDAFVRCALLSVHLWSSILLFYTGRIVWIKRTEALKYRAI